MRRRRTARRSRGLDHGRNERRRTAARTRGIPGRKTRLAGQTKSGGGRRMREREQIRSRRREEAKAPQRPPPPSPDLRAHTVRPPWRNSVLSELREFWSIAETGWDDVRTFLGDATRQSFDRRTQSILRRSLMASPYGPLGRLPPGVLRRVRGDPRDRLGPVLRATPQAVLHRPRVRGGPAANPRRPAARCAAEDRPRTPVLRRADVRGAPDLGRRFEVHVIVPPPKAHAPRGPPSGPTRARERVLDQGPRGGPETSLGEPFELPR